MVDSPVELAALVSTSDGFISLACLGGEKTLEIVDRERERERERERDIQCLPVFLVHSPQVSVEPRLAVEGIFASSDWAFELLWLTVDGLDVHQ